MIWRKPGTRCREQNIVERNHYRGGGLLVWSMNSRTEVYEFAGGSVTAVRYCDELLHPLARLLSLQWVPTRYLWMITPKPHRARLVRSYRESETIPQVAWPARSQDPNPI
ncbi:hypothetical protein AVEN_197104-1 [Araneus ventricosus]|uniref:Uncharacterized protein n=1 Tax=Araneus ventricosus TaxID=182803 RepID=A0A4Y2IYV5_ARAVE|nr:hypothetical protein AVEN_197104-1 [Araneus ventricosus]